MAVLELKPGDGFCVKTNTPIADLIILKQILSSLDSKAEYNHAGIILNANGDTFESNWRIDHYHLEQYKGCPMIIARYKNMTPERFEAGMQEVLQYDGKIYPFWRLPLHLFGLAKFFRLTYPVCSELVAEFAWAAGMHGIRGWGWTPDNLADVWVISKYVDIIFQGVWE